MLSRKVVGYTLYARSRRCCSTISMGCFRPLTDSCSRLGPYALSAWRSWLYQPQCPSSLSFSSAFRSETINYCGVSIYNVHRRNNQICVGRARVCETEKSRVLALHGPSWCVIQRFQSDAGKYLTSCEAAKAGLLRYSLWESYQGDDKGFDKEPCIADLRTHLHLQYRCCCWLR